MAVYFNRSGGAYRISPSPNVAYTKIGYPISSSYVSLDTAPDQYQVILDIYESGSSDLIKRINSKPPSDMTYGFVVDPSKVFQGELDFDNNWKITGSVDPVNAVKTFELKAGEIYGTSPSSSLTIYPNQDTETVTIFPGTIYPPDNLISTNQFWFNSSSIAGGTNILSNVPEAQYNPPFEDLLYLGYNDYHTITILNADAAFNVRVFDVNNTVTYSAALSASNFGTVGIGPQNLKDYGVSSSIVDNAARITVTSLGSPNYSVFLPLYPDNPFVPCSDEYTRFAFINRYGFWDYYNVYNPVRTETTLDRELFNMTSLDTYQTYFGTRYQQAHPYNRQLHLSSRDVYSIDTDYISKPLANWLEELIESPSVFIQQGSEFIPIVITDTSYTHNNDQSRNKLFKYTINWVTANPRRSRV